MNRQRNNYCKTDSAIVRDRNNVYATIYATKFNFCANKLELINYYYYFLKIHLHEIHTI